MQISPGTRAFVTGASRGIGRVLAQALAARGAVVGLAARSIGELREARREPARRAPRDRVRRHRRRVGAGGPFRDQSLDDALAMSQVNWHGTLHTVHAGLPHLLEGAHGHIVVVSSGAGLRSFPGAAGEIATSLHDHEQGRMPEWYRGGPSAAAPEPLAGRVVAAVEGDARAVHFPPLVRVLGALHGVSPRAADALLRRLRGSTAAPRRD